MYTYIDGIGWCIQRGTDEEQKVDGREDWNICCISQTKRSTKRSKRIQETNCLTAVIVLYLTIFRSDHVFIVRSLLKRLQTPIQNCEHKQKLSFPTGIVTMTMPLEKVKTTVVPALGDPRRERPPAVYGHFVNVPTHFNVKLPVISGHLPNADADSHLLVVSTCYNGQCKQMPRFQWSFQPKIACAHPNLRPSILSNVRAVVW